MSGEWHILGAGAIGGLFARRLQLAGATVVVLSRHAAEKTRTLHFIDHGQTSNIALPCEPFTEGPPVSRLLVCTKAPGVLPALTSMASRISTDTQLILLVNGMGIGERVRAQFPNNAIAIGTTTAACFRDQNGAWNPVAAGETYLGWMDQRRTALPDWIELWQAAVSGFGWQEDIEEKLLAKLAVNAVINPATALWDVSNGAIIEPPLEKLSQQACAEVGAVLAQAGLDELSTTVQQRVWSVAAATAANTSSMRADLQAKRATEVEAILGYLLDTLKQRGAHPPATPLLDEWLQQLRDYEATRTAE